MYTTPSQDPQRPTDPPMQHSMDFFYQEPVAPSVMSYPQPVSSALQFPSARQSDMSFPYLEPHDVVVSQYMDLQSHVPFAAEAHPVSPYGYPCHHSSHATPLQQQQMYQPNPENNLALPGGNPFCTGNFYPTCSDAQNALQPPCNLISSSLYENSSDNPFEEPFNPIRQSDSQFQVPQSSIFPAGEAYDTLLTPNLDAGCQFSSICHAEKSSAVPSHVSSDQRKETDNHNIVSQNYQNQPMDSHIIHIQPMGDEKIIPTDSSVLADMNNDIFNSAYIDTISSVNSAQFLIRPSDTDEENASTDEEVKKIYFNTGFTPEQSQEATQEKVNAAYPEEEEEGEKECVPLLEQQENIPEVKEINLYQDLEASHPDTLKQVEDFIHHHLIPIGENDVLCLDIQEIESIAAAHIPPSSSSPHYTRITNNITAVDESFLFESQNNLSDPGATKSGKRAGTMQNLHERNSFLDLTNFSRLGKACQRSLIYLKDDLTFGSLASLNTIAAKNTKYPAQIIGFMETHKEMDVIPSAKHRKNVLALSFCITLYFIAMGSVRNLQSSLNQEGGVGIISMAVSFVGYMIGSIFSASIVLSFQPRKCIIINLIPNLFYIAANIYPTVWLMAPASLIQGISLAIIWNAMSTYITFLSRGRALKKGEDFEKVSSNFFGIFCLIYQSYHIIGNLIASLVLMPRSHVDVILNNATHFLNATNVNDTVKHSSDRDILFEPGAPFLVPFEVDSLPQNNDNATLTTVNHLRLCGAEFCNHYEVGGGSGFAVNDETKYLLLGIYMGIILLSMAIAAFFLEPLNPRLFHSTGSNLRRLKQQLISLSKFAINGKFLLLLPLLMYSIMQFGFISGEVTVAFVTCPIGIHMVGYTMICFGVCASTSSYFSGLLCKYTGRVPQMVLAGALNMAVLMFVTQWKPTLDSLFPYFVIMGLWGVSDGIWNCQVNSLMGVIFLDKYEEAYAGLRVAQGLGVAILFSYSNYVCMAHKIYIIGSICIIAMMLYLVMEVMLRYQIKRKVSEYKQTSV